MALKQQFSPPGSIIGAGQIKTDKSAYDVVRLIGRAGIVADNRLIEYILRTEGPGGYEGLFPCWTSTLVVYGSPNEQLGKRIVSGDFVFNVPKRYQKMENVALVLSGLKVRRSSGKYVLAGEISVIEDFPIRNGWYKQDAGTGIPKGGEVSQAEDGARRLWRNDGPYIGLVARAHWREVNLDKDQSLGLGMAAATKLPVIPQLDLAGQARDASR